MKSIEFKWTEHGMEFIDGKLVSYSREYVPPEDAPRTLIFAPTDISARDRFFRVLNMQRTGDEPV